jgi:hypothetical protein
VTVVVTTGMLFRKFGVPRLKDFHITQSLRRLYSIETYRFHRCSVLRTHVADLRLQLVVSSKLETREENFEFTM